MDRTVFITGANRGIGLEFAKQYAQDGWIVYATCRNLKNALELRKLSNTYPNLHILQLKVDSEENIENLKIQLMNIPIDIVINNAGTLGNKIISLNKINQKELIEHFVVNSIAPLLISKVLIPNLNLGKLKTIVSLSSNIASLNENYAGEWNVYAYKSSKAALNMLMRCLSAEEIHSNIRVLLLQPGWVKTDMGGIGAEIEPKVSVAGMRKIIEDSEKINSGSFLTYQGQVVPW